MKPPLYRPDPAKLKRTNWTTEEVIGLIEGCRLYNMDGNEDTVGGTHSDAITTVLQTFGDFLRPENQSGAMAYDPASKQVYHVGPRLSR